MDARAKSVSEILHTGDQYVVPLFQRSYSWQKTHWERLNADIMALVEDPSRHVHFLGPLVCTPSKHIPGNVPTYQLIDGQQRLTTLTVVLAGIRDVARARGQAELADEITEDYLIHKRKQEMERFKVLPRVGDREALMAIIDAGDTTPFASLRLIHAWRFFRRQILHRARRDPETVLRNLFDTVTRRLSLVVVTIDGENPYEIFESLNATGLPLAESDLIRNYVFMQIPIKQQDAFDKNHWQQLEQCFDAWGDERATIMTEFYRDYLMREGRYSREKSTFVDFKLQQKDRKLDALQQAAELRHFAPLAVQIRKPATCPSKAIQQSLEQIERMDIGTAHAFVLHLLDRHAKGDLSEANLCTCLNDLVSFVLRRTICGDTTRTYGRWFIEAIGQTGKDPVQNLQRYWLQRGWPDDTAVLRALGDFAFYKREPSKARMVLEVLERYSQHKEQVVLSPLTIEHVMPQAIKNDKPGLTWQTALGENWEDAHERYLDVLGNLTLTGYNPELGKMAFADKQAYYRESHVELNRYFHTLASWDAEGIRKRTTVLAEKICLYWPRPTSNITYVGDENEDIENIGDSSAKQRNLDYWRLFLKQWHTRTAAPAPAPSPSGELVFPLSESGDITAHLWLFRRARKLVAFVKFAGKSAVRLYAHLQTKAKEIDDLIEGDLQWNWPAQNCFAVCEEEVDLSDRNDWELQHAWFCEELTDIIDALTPECKAWCQAPADPTDSEEEEPGTGDWNGEYYASFGYDVQVVRDGLKHGYLVAGGGSWYTKTLAMLEPGNRIWVNVPSSGYVAVGIVAEKMQVIDHFTVPDASGKQVPLSTVSPEVFATLRKEKDNAELTDYLVRVKWLKTVDPDQAVHEKGFFGNQNSIARPRSTKWIYTVERLKVRFGVK